MARINAEWHRANRMPMNPTREQRIAWHVAHAAACGCREVPASIRDAVEERQGKQPVPRPRKPR